MFKIRDDVDLKELERFLFTHHDKQDAKICYYRPMPLVKKKIPILVEIFKDKEEVKQYFENKAKEIR